MSYEIVFYDDKHFQELTTFKHQENIGHALKYALGRDQDLINVMEGGRYTTIVVAYGFHENSFWSFQNNNENYRLTHFTTIFQNSSGVSATYHIYCNYDTRLNRVYYKGFSKINKELEMRTVPARDVKLFRRM